MLAAAMFFVAGTIVAVIWWFRPPPPFLLVLIGSGYEENLAVPHNAPGLGGLEALKAWGEEHTHQKGGSTTEILSPTADNVQKALSFGFLKNMRKPPETVVVFVTAHAVLRDKDGAPRLCLVPEKDNLATEKDLCPLDEVLKALKDLPPKTQKLLILDCTTAAAHEPLGMLHNDFARLLKEREKDIRDMALVVLSSSGEDQRSWAAPEWGQTVFAHFVLEGLRGAADQHKGGGGHDSSVSALELHQYVADEVKKWARVNRAHLQEPVLLGGEDRARKLEIARYRNYQPAESSPKQPEFATVSDAWKERDDLEKSSPHPAVYTPHLWRRYLDTLVRAEELLRWSRPAAPSMLKKARDLAEQIRSKQEMSNCDCLQLTLPMPEALGLRLKVKEETALAGWTQAWQQGVKKTDVGEAIKGLDKLLDEAGGDRRRKYFLRVRATEVVVRDTIRDPASLDGGLRVLEKLEDIVDPKYCRPAEAHYLRMLRPNPNDPAERAPAAALLREDQRELLRLSLEVRRQAELAALGLADARAGLLPAYSEQVRPWVSAAIDQADKSRRLGEDLLFTSQPGSAKAEGGQSAKELLDGAMGDYRKAQGIAAVVRRALFQRDKALADLPYYSRWVAEQTTESVEKAEDLWGQVRQLRDDLEKQEFKGLEELAKKVETGLETLLGRVMTQAREAMAQGNIQINWHRIEATLAVPFLPEDLREHLVAAGWGVGETLRDPAKQKNLGGEINPQHEVDEAEITARRRFRLAEAALGLKGEEREWHLLVKDAGMRVGKVRNGRPEEAEKEKDPAKAARLAREVDGGAVGNRLQRDPVGQLRSLQLHELFAWQAQRTYRDYWAECNQKENKEFYFQKAGKQFLADAKELLDDAEKMAGAAVEAEKEKGPAAEEWTRLRARLVDWQGRLTAARGIGIVSGPTETGPFHSRPGEFDLKSTEGAKRFFCLTGPEDKEKEVLGQPVYWEENRGAGLPASVPERKLTVFRDRNLDRVKGIEGTAPSGADRHEFHGYFRGHGATAESLVLGDPTLVWKEPPVAAGAHVAVQSRGKLYDKLGAENVAVAILLDCSASMSQPEKPGGAPKWDQAKRVLQRVLQELPDGVTVSVRGFTTDRQFNPVMRRLLHAEKWDEKQRTALKGKLEELTLVNGTPIIDAIWRAHKEDLPSEFEARTIVVITDGGDNTFYWSGNADLRKRVQANTIKQFFSKHFEDSDTQVCVIGYAIGDDVSAEEKRGHQELKKALEEGGGRYFPASEADSLETALMRSILHMFYRVDPDVRASARVPLGWKNITRTDQEESPSWVDLKPDRYRVSLSRLKQLIELQRGDALLLELEPSGNRPAFRRALYSQCEWLQKHQPQMKTREQAGWRLAVPENRTTLREPLRLQVTLEQDPGPAMPSSLLQQAHPAWKWFEVLPPREETPARLEWQPLPNYPAPAWQLAAPDWQRKDGPTLRTWWLEKEKDLPTAETLALEDLFKNPQRVNERWGEKLKKVSLDSPPRLEHRSDLQGPDLSCLVVRLHFPKDQDPFYVRLRGLDEGHGEEHRFYRTIGVYIGTFWPVDPEDIKRLTLELYSVADLKAKARPMDETRKKQAQWVELKLEAPDNRSRQPAVGEQ
jgi:uncharacterized caspase-like protein